MILSYTLVACLACAAATQKLGQNNTHAESATCYGRRYADLFTKFCENGSCDVHALHAHFRNQGQREGRRFGCAAGALGAAEAARWAAGLQAREAPRAEKVAAARAEPKPSEHRNCSPSAVTAKPWLAFGASIRNEAPYLLEWVEFHLPVGFDIFYVWDDGSTDASLSVIQQYIDSGVVRRLDMGGVKGQTGIYTQMVRQADHDGVEWLMLTDVDAFVFPERATSLRDILTSFDSSVGAIGLSLFQFDHNGRMQQDAGPVIERFVHRRKNDDPFNGAMTRTSSLLRVKNVITMGVHSPLKLRKGTHFVDVLGSPMPLWPYAKGKNIPGVYEVILANHYYCKSYEEFKRKNQRNQMWGSKISTWNERCEHPWALGENDTTILKFLPELKRRLACSVL